MKVKYKKIERKVKGKKVKIENYCFIKVLSSQSWTFLSLFYVDIDFNMKYSDHQVVKIWIWFDINKSSSCALISSHNVTNICILTLTNQNSITSLIVKNYWSKPYFLLKVLLILIFLRNLMKLLHTVWMQEKKLLFIFLLFSKNQKC